MPTCTIQSVACKVACSLSWREQEIYRHSTRQQYSKDPGKSRSSPSYQQCSNLESTHLNSSFHRFACTSTKPQLDQPWCACAHKPCLPALCVLCLSEAPLHLLLEGLPGQMWQLNSRVGNVHCLCRASADLHDLKTCAWFCALYDQSPVTSVASISQVPLPPAS